MDEEVWNQFANNREELSRIANLIRNNYSNLSQPLAGTLDAEPVDAEEEFPEGRTVRRLHDAKERNPQATKNKKKQVLQRMGKLECEVCSFDFTEYYGENGVGFTECHHIVPLSQLEPGHHTKLSELAIVCANCHRMLHKVRPWLTVWQLKGILKTRGKVVDGT